MLLDPNVEIILIGDDHGAAEVCQEFGIRHEPQVRRSSTGAVYLDDIFDRGQRLAAHPVTCYVNCDIMLLSDFREAISRVASCYPRFLVAGRRWDTDIRDLWDFNRPTWEVDLRYLVSERGRMQPTPSTILPFLVVCMITLLR